MAYTSDEKNWSLCKKELNNSKGGGKRERAEEKEATERELPADEHLE